MELKKMISPEKKNFTKARLQQVLDYCERSFVEQIGGGFTSQLETVLESLKALSQESKRYQEKQFYNEIYFTLLNSRSDMSVDFKMHLKKYFKERIQSQLANNDVSETHSFKDKNSLVKTQKELSIVSDSEENKYITEKSLEKQLDDNLGDELNALSMRIEFILGENVNPFSPDILAKALSATIDKIIVDNNAHTQVVKAFGQVWPEHIKTTYQGINNYLVANDVIPDMQTHMNQYNIRKKENAANQSNIIKDDNPVYQGNDVNNLQNQQLKKLPNLPNFNNFEGLSQMNKGFEEVDNLMPRFKDLHHKNNFAENFNLPLPDSFQKVKEHVDASSQSMPGFEHISSDKYYNASINNQENLSVEEKKVESYKVYETDTQEQKLLKWKNVKEIISNNFNKLLGKVKSVTPIKELMVQSQYENKAENPDSLSSENILLQKRQHSYHKFVNEAVIAQKEAIINGTVFKIPEGLTSEQLDAHANLLVSRENSIMLNDSSVIESFTNYQQEFLSMNMTNTVTLNRDLEGSLVLNPYRNVLSEIAQASVQNHKMDPNETMIVDLLSLVFDKIFSHSNLPEHIKYLIGKLQIPILKTSLLDKTFFIYRDNPVRLFLDCLGTHETLYNLEYHSKFEIIIDNLLTKQDISQESFSDALDKIQVMLKEYATKEVVFIKKVAVPIRLEERASENYDYVLKYMSKLIKRTTYEPVISFIENVWSKAFADKWTNEESVDNEGFMTNLSLPGKINLNQSLLVFEMIIWSTEVKFKTPESREKLKLYIPKIAEGLRIIIKELNISEDDFQRLSALLTKQQIDFLNENQEKTEKQKNETMEDEQNAVIYFAEKVEPMRKVKAASKDILKAKSDFDDVFISGRWFEFNHDKSKMRLVWVSPQKTMYLFNNPEKKKVYKFDKSRVWSYYRSSHIKLISNEKEIFTTDKIISDAVNNTEED